MKKFKLAILIGSLFLLAACASNLNKSESISLSKVEKTDWKTINRLNAVEVFGNPKLRSQIDNEKKEAWIYGRETAHSPHLALIFEIKTDALITANWFFNSSEPEVNLTNLVKRYPRQKFDLENPVESDGLNQPKMLFYPSKQGEIEIAVFKQSGHVSSLSWQTASNIQLKKRKPSSH